MLNVLLILAAMAAWALLHSLMASSAAKGGARRWLGPRAADAFYRLAYNAAAAVTFAPVVALVALLPDVTLYRLPLWAAAAATALRALAALGLVGALLQADLPRFVGVRQIARWLNGLPDPRDPPKLVVTGFYRWVRHPLYTLSLVALWLAPAMTLNLLAFNLGATLYFWIGSIFEERKLVAEFGEAYREYQRRVPRLVPWPAPRRGPGTAAD